MEKLVISNGAWKFLGTESMQPGDSLRILRKTRKAWVLPYAGFVGLGCISAVFYDVAWSGSYHTNYRSALFSWIWTDWNWLMILMGMIKGMSCCVAFRNRFSVSNGGRFFCPLWRRWTSSAASTRASTKHAFGRWTPTEGHIQNFRRFLSEWISISGVATKNKYGRLDRRVDCWSGPVDVWG